MTKVMCFGTFDVLHKGHEYFLTKAKGYGDLVVVIALDQTVEKVKGKLPRNNQDKRLENLRNLKIADKVILGNPGDKYKVIRDENPDIICLGYDQDSFTKGLEELNIKIIRIDSFHPEKYKSSLMLP